MTTVLDPQSFTIVTTPFDPEQTRPFFEEALIKAYMHPETTKEEVREYYLKRDQYFPEGYREPHVAMEWIGWKNGIKYGYELRGKK